MIQLDSHLLHNSFRAKFARDLGRAFAADLGPVARQAGPDATEQFFRQCLTRSEQSGFALQGEIVKYSFLAVHLGLYFEQDPLFQAIRDDALWMQSGVHENVGLNRLFNSTDLMVAEELAGADQGFVPGFPAACDAAAQPFGHPLDRALDICIAANPKRAHALGEGAMQAALAAAWRDLDANHHRFADYPLEWMVCTAFLGHGFARSPIHAWVPWTFAQGGLSLVRRKLDG